MDLLKVDSLETVREKMLDCFRGKTRRMEVIPIREASGRILSRDVISGEDVPGFSKSTVDGYAVRAADTQGASETIPTYLHYLGEVSMGKQAGMKIGSGECTYVPTGGMIPEGADAMVMIEYTEDFLGDIAVYHSVSAGRNIIRRGDDVKRGGIVIPAGTRLRPQEIGLLASVGIYEVWVYAPWRAAVFSTGDELIQPGEEMCPGQIRESNSFALQALAQQSGMEVVRCSSIKDDPEVFIRALEECREDCDLVITSGGSSQGKYDMTECSFRRVAGDRILTHGIALKPGKPTVIAFDEQKDTMFIGLPGHPVAAIVVYLLLVDWLNKVLKGEMERNRCTFAKMGCNVAAGPGRATCILVRLEKQGDLVTAWPIFGKSGMLDSLVKSDGYVLLDRNQEGVKQGELVEVTYI